MANWGTFDYSKGSAEQLAIDAEAEVLRRSLDMQGKTSAFGYNELVARGYSQDLIQLHCVRNASWQAVRLSMKGVSTTEKLDILHAYWERNYGVLGKDKGYDICALQIGNYLGALRRGGQLDDLNRVRKAR